MLGKNNRSSHLKVLITSAEVAPYSSVGGLSQVSYFLSRALLKLGVEVAIFTPKYGVIDEAKFPMRVVMEGLKVPTDENNHYPHELVCNVKTLETHKKGEPMIFFLENMEYYEKRANVYGYTDDHIRFGLLSRGVLEFVKQGFFAPDLIHVNDWHTAYLINYLKEIYQDEGVFKKIATLLSIHNTYQGNFDFTHASEMDFDDGKGPLASLYSDRFLKQNALKRGIINCDLMNTVSESYAHELLTEQYGAGLQNLFKELRGKLFGVLNGLDYNTFDPRTDKIIKRNFSFKNINARLENKTDLQKEFNLTVSAKTPIIAMSGRLDWQKGVDIVMETIEFILSEFDVQFVVLGGCDYGIKDFFENLEKKYPGKVGTHLMPNFALPRKIFAGADMLLMPSRYEPGGIVAMEAMRYGAVPVVRATGGLADSVQNFDPVKGTGNGFSFKNYSGMSLITAVVRALETYRNPLIWNRILRQAMTTDFSWEHAAEKYLDLYKRAVELRKEALLPNPSIPFKQMN